MVESTMVNLMKLLGEDDLSAPVKNNQMELHHKSLAEAHRLFSIGDKVMILHTGYIGRVAGFNDNVEGFFPAYLYPVNVEITSTDNPNRHKIIGRQFCYSINQLSEYKGDL